MPASSSHAPAPTAGRLVIQLARLGDFLQTTPLLAALKQADPTSPLAVLVTPFQEPLARGCSWVDQALLLDPATVEDAARAARLDPALARARLAGLWEPLWAWPAREIINLNLSRLAAAALLGWPGAAVSGWRLPSAGGPLVGAPWANFLLRLVANRRLTRLHLSDILASYADPPGPPLPRLAFAPAPPDQAAARRLSSGAAPLVVFQLGANNDLRRWPLASFTALAQGLLAQGCRLALVGAGWEAPLAARFLDQLRPPDGAVASLMGRTTLPVLGALLARAALVVSADTGTLHMATAVGAPVLALYMGPAQVHETGPYGPGHLVLAARDQCGPCQENNPVCHGQASCRGLITPAAALTAALGLLAGEAPAALASCLDLPPGVTAWLGAHDAFGQVYRPLTPLALTAEEALALALRQAGRVLLRRHPGGQTGHLGPELARDFLPPPPAAEPELAHLAHQARELALAVAQNDPARARATAQSAPGLTPLAALVGPAPPPRLAQAASDAAQVLAAALELG
ncbi:MAG: glycosyltransferase family 9 protein [Deltaproteobacteria bacterium]|nr:glycosyltransferase family 9 protein [Deltaproteobacteria bacterium]